MVLETDSSLISLIWYSSLIWAMNKSLFYSFMTWYERLVRYSFVKVDRDMPHSWHRTETWHVHTVVWCSVLQCVAVCGSVLQCATVCRCALQCVLALCVAACVAGTCVAVCCSVLQCVAVWCSVLQCVVVCYWLIRDMGWLRLVGSLKL